MSKNGVVASTALAASFALVTTMAIIKIASAPKSHVQPTTETLKKLDQAIEQNRTLQQRKRELVKQINALRQSQAAQDDPVLDKLIEQSRELQQENIDMMKRINSLR